MSAGVAYALLLGLGLGPWRVPTAGMSLVAMFRAEAVKILLIVGELWLVLSTYKDVVPVGVLRRLRRHRVIFSMAFFCARD